MQINMHIGDKLYVFKDKFIPPIKFLMMYCEYLEQNNYTKISNFFKLPMKKACLKTIGDLIRPDIFFKSIIQEEMQKIFELFVKYKNNNHEIHFNAERETLREILKAIFSNNNHVINTFLRFDIGHKETIIFSEKLMRIANAQELILQPLSEIQSVSVSEIPCKVTAPTQYKEVTTTVKPEILDDEFEKIDLPNHNLLSLEVLEEQLDSSINLLTKYYDNNGFLKIIFTIFVSAKQDKSAISLSYDKPFSTFLKENAFMLNNTQQRNDIIDGLLKNGLRFFTIDYILTITEMYYLLKELEKNQQQTSNSQFVDMKQFVENQEITLKLLKKCPIIATKISKLIKSALLFAEPLHIMYQNKINITDAIKLLKLLKCLDNFNKETFKVYHQKKHEYAFANTQKRVGEGIFYSFNYITSKAISSVIELCTGTKPSLT